MTNWTLSDGTEIALGGDITGDSDVADVLRDRVDCVREGGRYPVQISAPPSPARDLDLDDPLLVDAWIRDVARWKGVELVSGPEVEHPPAEGGTGLPGLVY